MNRNQMEHVLRAAAAITRERDFIILGSQSLLGAFPQLPPPLNQSMEIDLYPENNPAAADLIDGSIGELSMFHEAFGYYAHGVGPETAMLPCNWRARVLEVANPGAGMPRAFCLAPADLAVSKLIAGREKDLGFVAAMLRLGMVDRSKIMSALDELDARHRRAAQASLNAIADIPPDPGSNRGQDIGAR